MADPWIILEPYYGGSHRALVDGLRSRMKPEAVLWTLPPRKWKWRMRGAALAFARRWRSERPRVAGIFTSSLLNAAELRGLLPERDRGLPILLYFHENQLNYPLRVSDPRDYHYGWINILSALAADRLAWNSRFNMESFLGGIESFVSKMPDQRPRRLAESIREKSTILPVPVDVGGAISRKRGERCRLLWNHRWEHDKNPEEFFSALFDLEAEGLDFELSVIGKDFRERPEIFAVAKSRLGKRIRSWGFLEDRGEYRRQLDRADYIVSTSLHEFQGLSVLEAAARGARPLLPADLVYPEIWPDDFLYERKSLRPALRERIVSWPVAVGPDPRAVALGYSWESLGARWRSLFDDFLPA